MGIFFKTSIDSCEMCSRRGEGEESPHFWHYWQSIPASAELEAYGPEPDREDLDNNNSGIQGPSVPQSNNSEDQSQPQEDRESTLEVSVEENNLQDNRPPKRRRCDLTASQRRQEAEDHWDDVIACATRDFESRRVTPVTLEPAVHSISLQTEVEALTGKIICEPYVGADVERLRTGARNIDVTVQTIVTGDYILIKK